MDGLLTFFWLTTFRIVLPVAVLLTVGTLAQRRHLPRGGGG